MEQRFIIVEGSQSGHCCFEFSIVDTQTDAKNVAGSKKLIMCECFDKDEAETICNSLNFIEMMTGKEVIELLKSTKDAN